MQANELKPCPFCNGKAKYIYSSHVPTYPIGVRCNRCKSEFQFYDKNENTMTDAQKISNRFNKRK